MHFRLATHNKAVQAAPLLCGTIIMKNLKCMATNINEYHNKPLFRRFFGDKNEGGRYSKEKRYNLREREEADSHKSVVVLSVVSVAKKGNNVSYGCAQQHPRAAKSGENVSQSAGCTLGKQNRLKVLPICIVLI